MALMSFVLGIGFGAIVLSTIPTTGKAIAEISPYFKQGLDFSVRLITYLGQNLN